MSKKSSRVRHQVGRGLRTEGSTVPTGWARFSLSVFFSRALTRPGASAFACAFAESISRERAVPRNAIDGDENTHTHNSRVVKTARHFFYIFRCFDCFIALPSPLTSSSCLEQSTGALRVPAVPAYARPSVAGCCSKLRGRLPVSARIGHRDHEEIYLTPPKNTLVYPFFFFHFFRRFLPPGGAVPSIPDARCDAGGTVPFWAKWLDGIFRGQPR